MICKHCNKTFSTYTKINGKTKNLCKRKYCLECSPWGQHNTRPFNYIKTGIQTSIQTTERPCPICNKPYKGKGTKCGSCLVNIRRFKIKQQCIEYKGGKCEKCHYNKCPAAMVFHHLDPLKKDFGIGGSHCRSFEKLKIELDKCILLCQNCHNEHHYNEHNEIRNKIIDYLK